MTLKPAKRAFFSVAMILAIAGQTKSASAQAITVTLSLQLPIVIDVFVPCANGGAGELVTLSGTLHEIVHATFDSNGDVHAKLLDQPQGISGFGQTSGTRYQGTGVTQQVSNTNPFTFVNNFRIIGQGPDNNFLLHQLLHLTLNTKGAATALVDRASVECR